MDQVVTHSLQYHVRFEHFWHFSGLCHPVSVRFPRRRITKSSCACDSGKDPVSVGAFFLSFVLSFRVPKNQVF